MSECAWVADGLAQFVRSPMWTAPINNFVDDQCIFFDSESEMKLEYTTIHGQFRELVDTLLTTYVEELGVPAEDALEAVRQSTDPTHRQLTEYLTYLDDFQSFKKLMEKRNVELEFEAMKELERHEASGRGRSVEGGAVSSPSAESPSGNSDEAGEVELAIEESRRQADLIMKEAEMEDLELQRALALSLAMENERIAREKEAAAAAAAATAAAVAPTPAAKQQPEAPAAPPAPSAEELTAKAMEARVRNLEDASKKIAALPQPATSQSSASSAATPMSPPPSEVSSATPTPAVAGVVRITAPSTQGLPPPTSAAKLAPLGRKIAADPLAFKSLAPSTTFKQLVAETHDTPSEASSAASPQLPAPSMEDLQRRAAELKRQRDLIIEQRKKERSSQLAAGGSSTTTAEEGKGSTSGAGIGDVTGGAEAEKERQKQMTIEIARRFRDDLVGESRK